MMRSAALFANWRENIIRMWQRTKRPPRRSLSKSTKLTKCWAIRRSEENMISLAPTGINQGGFSRLLGGAHNSPAADFIVMEVRMAVLNLNSAAPDLATFSKLFSAVAAGDLPLADLVDARQRRSAAVT